VKHTERQIKDSIGKMQDQIADYESRIRGLKADIQGSTTALVELRMNNAPIIVGS